MGLTDIPEAVMTTSTAAIDLSSITLDSLMETVKRVEKLKVEPLNANLSAKEIIELGNGIGPATYNPQLLTSELLKPTYTVSVKDCLQNQLTKSLLLTKEKLTAAAIFQVLTDKGYMNVASVAGGKLVGAGGKSAKFDYSKIPPEFYSEDWSPKTTFIPSVMSGGSISGTLEFEVADMENLKSIMDFAKASASSVLPNIDPVPAPRPEQPNVDFWCMDIWEDYDGI